MEFSRQEYWSGLPFPSPVGLPNPEIEPLFLASASLAGGVSTTCATSEASPIYFKERNVLTNTSFFRLYAIVLS